jgi:hypothetical protein
LLVLETRNFASLTLSASMKNTYINLTHEHNGGSSDYDPVWPKNDRKIYIFDYSEWKVKRAIRREKLE